MGIHSGIDEVIDVIEDRIEYVVVGLPLLLNGEAGKSAKKARRLLIWEKNGGGTG